VDERFAFSRSLTRELLLAKAGGELGWHSQEFLAHRDHEISELPINQAFFDQLVAIQSQVYGLTFELKIQPQSLGAFRR
jgi:hypothetical protein